MTEELFIKLFVKTEINQSALLMFVADVVCGIIDMWTVICGPIEFDVRPNNDFNAIKIKSDPYAFIFFQYTIEISAPSNHPLDEYLSIVSRLMEAVAENGGAVVAACDWEDKLPGGGHLGL